MATVTGLTAARMKIVEGQSIVDARLEGDDLILTSFDETDINVGNVRGPAGPQGESGLIRTINGKQPINGDATITAEDLGAVGPTSLNAAIKAILPAGTILPTGRTGSPTGFLICDGRAVIRADYPDLFAAISTRYGVGNGTTTFNIPDFRGRVPVGLYSADTMFDTLGEKGGSKTHTHTSGDMKGRISWGADGKIILNRAGAGDTWTGNAESVSNAVPLKSSTEKSSGGLALVGDTGSESNIQPYQVVNYMIKT